MPESVTAVTIKVAVFWNVAPCSLIEIYWPFRGRYSLLPTTIRSSETSVGIYRSTWRHMEFVSVKKLKVQFKTFSYFGWWPCGLISYK